MKHIQLFSKHNFQTLRQILIILPFTFLSDFIHTFFRRLNSLLATLDCVFT